jgi:hypothetical protein
MLACVAAIGRWEDRANMSRRSNWWLTGIGTFTAVMFGFLAYFNWRIYTFRHEVYYIAGMLVFGAIAVLSIYAVINSWRNALPGQAREPADEPRGPGSSE